MPRQPTLPSSAGETFAQRLRRLRMQRGFTIRALAERIGAAPHTVRGWGYGHEPYAASLVHLARALGVSVDYLLTGEECAELQRAVLRLEAANAEIAALRMPRPRVPFRIGQAA